jgi:hypothetical protein
MAVHWYLLPLDPATRSPRHLEPPEAGERWAAVRYFHGDDASFQAVVKADISEAKHAAILADGDCVVLPDPDTTLGAGAVAGVQTTLENRNIPAGWVTAGMTYREIYRRIILMGMMWTRFRGRTLGNNFFGGGVTLETTLASLPAGVRQHLNGIADEFGVSRAGVVTVRDALQAFWQAVKDRPIEILDERL